jgi:hypothetical protein
MRRICRATPTAVDRVPYEPSQFIHSAWRAASCGISTCFFQKIIYFRSTYLKTIQVMRANSLNKNKIPRLKPFSLHCAALVREDA